MKTLNITLICMGWIMSLVAQAAVPNYKGMPIHQDAYNAGYELGSLYACKDTLHYKGSYTATYKRSQPYRGQLNVYNRAYNQGVSAGLEKPISCETHKQIAMPAVLNQSTQTVKKEKLVEAIENYYNTKGMWAGKYKIVHLVRLRIEENGPALNVHVHYKSTPLPAYQKSHRAKEGYDKRIFMVLPQGETYAVLSMSDYMTAKFSI